MSALGSLPICKWRGEIEGEECFCASPNMVNAIVPLMTCATCIYANEEDRYPELPTPEPKGDCEGCQKKPAPITPPPICIWEAHPGKWHRLVTSSPNGCACKHPEFIAPHQGYMVKTFCRDAAAAQVTQYDHGEDEDD